MSLHTFFAHFFAVELADVAGFVKISSLALSVFVSLLEIYGVFVLLGHDKSLSGGTVSGYTSSRGGVSDHTSTARLDSTVTVGSSYSVRKGVTVRVHARDAGSAGTGERTAAGKVAASGSGSGSTRSRSGSGLAARLRARGGLSAARGTFARFGGRHSFYL